MSPVLSLAIMVESRYLFQTLGKASKSHGSCAAGGTGGAIAHEHAHEGGHMLKLTLDSSARTSSLVPCSWRARRSDRARARARRRSMRRSWRRSSSSTCCARATPRSGAVPFIRSIALGAPRFRRTCQLLSAAHRARLSFCAESRMQSLSVLQLCTPVKLRLCDSAHIPQAFPVTQHADPTSCQTQHFMRTRPGRTISARWIPSTGSAPAPSGRRPRWEPLRAEVRSLRAASEGHAEEIRVVRLLSCPSCVSLPCRCCDCCLYCGVAVTEALQIFGV